MTKIYKRSELTKVYKRSELTSSDLERWEREAAQDLILSTADNAFDLCMQIAEVQGEAVELQPDGTMQTADGWPVSYWRQSADGRYIEYLPGYGNTCKVIRGPW